MGGASVPVARQSRWPRAIGTLALAAGLSLAAMPVQALDVNTATIDQLRGIRGLGPKTAETIVKERERGGRFESMEDLSDRVRGIGIRRAQALEAAGLRVNGIPPPAGGRIGPGAAGAIRATPTIQSVPASARRGTERGTERDAEGKGARAGRPAAGGAAGMR
jgi:competence protein ComEA